MLNQPWARNTEGAFLHLAASLPKPSCQLNPRPSPQDRDRCAEATSFSTIQRATRFSADPAKPTFPPDESNKVFEAKGEFGGCNLKAMGRCTESPVIKRLP